MAEQTGQERTEDATPKRRHDARKKGTVARSTDLTSALVVGAVLIAIPSGLGLLGRGLTNGLNEAWRNPMTDPVLPAMLRYAWVFAQPCLGGLALLLCVAMAVGLASNIGQVGFVLSAEALQPNFAKLNPIEGIKRLFSTAAYFDALKALAKSLVFGFVAYSVIRSNWDEILGLGGLPANLALGQIGLIARAMAFKMVGVWLALAAIDYFFQRKRVDKSLRMTKEEVKQEMRQQEQSPEIRGTLARKRRQMARGRMMQNLLKADAVVTNPTHYAVALQYDQAKHPAPIVVAKGADLLAAKIREVADEHEIPIIPNPPLARALYRQCELGDVVPKDLFQPVAEVLAHVYKTIRKVRAGGS